MNVRGTTSNRERVGVDPKQMLHQASENNPHSLMKTRRLDVMIKGGEQAVAFYMKVIMMNMTVKGKIQKMRARDPLTQTMNQKRKQSKSRLKQQQQQRRNLGRLSNIKEVCSKLPRRPLLVLSQLEGKDSKEKIKDCRNSSKKRRKRKVKKRIIDKIPSKGSSPLQLI